MALSQKKLGIIAGVTSVVLYVLSPALTKSGLEGIDLSFFLVFRFLLASVLLLPFTVRALRRRPRPPTGLLVGLGIILGFNVIFASMALKGLPLSWYYVLYALSPAFSLLFMKAKFTKKLVVSIVLCVAGTLLFIEVGTLKSATMVAILYMTVSMAAWVAYTVWVKKLQSFLKDIEFTGVSNTLSLLVMTAYWTTQSAPMHYTSVWNFQSAAVMAVLIPFATITFSYSLRHAPVFGVVAQYLEPIIGVAIGVLFFGDSLSLVQAAGGVLILLGLGLL